MKSAKSILSLILLVLAGEGVFALPFVLSRIFRPTFLAAFQLNNFELGVCFSVYGIVAFFAYFFGGALADRYKPNVLIGVALISTALGGIYMSTYPSYFGMKVLFGYWGFTTIFLFWGAMVKATRLIGGDRQGTTFGFLDGGRGLVAALIGSIGVFIFSALVDESTLGIEERKGAFRMVILAASGFVAVVGLLNWLLLGSEVENIKSKSNIYSIKSFIEAIRIPTVLPLMLIILCAYVGYKVTDIVSLYANEVMLFNEVNAAHVGTLLLYMRPITGVLFGFLADKFFGGRLLLIGFTLSIIGALLFAFGILIPGSEVLFMMSVVVVAIGVYATRVLYYAILKEGNIPLAITGTVVGIISFVGYTPDIFMGPLLGIMLDDHPGLSGHQYVFMTLAGFAVLGLIATILFIKRSKAIAKA